MINIYTTDAIHSNYTAVNLIVAAAKLIGSSPWNDLPLFTAGKHLTILFNLLIRDLFE